MTARSLIRMLGKVSYEARGLEFGRRFEQQSGAAGATASVGVNALRDFFESRTEGRGIWKWTHYFDVYDRHLRGLRGAQIGLLEIGVLAGGSLEMWRDYFGPQAAIYGADINPDCMAHESIGVKMFIGDQGDRAFWRDVKISAPVLHVLIDDGSHRPEDQIATFEEMLPHLQPGGVYICEDTHGIHNGFVAYAQGLARGLGQMGEQTSELQRWIRGVFFYPHMVVIEKLDTPIARLHAPRRGDHWSIHGKR